MPGPCARARGGGAHAGGLQYIKLAPQRRSGCGLRRRARHSCLAKRYPERQVLGLDSRTQCCRLRASTEPGCGGAQARAHRLPVRRFRRRALAGSKRGPRLVQLALHCAGDPLPALKELRRVLKVGGLLMFSCYGPDTLKELRSAFAAHDSAAHVHNFIDMHDLGDMLSACGYAAPVMTWN